MSAPLLCAELPPCGGLFKAVPEDFVVEEVPAYEPCGEGPHLYLWVEKRGRDTQEAIREIASALGVDAREVGCAGQKDRQAVSRQYLSVPAAAEARLATLEPLAARGLLVLRHARHGNKLRTGHLRGNRFQVRLRQVRDAAAARAILARLVALGLPNAYGEQRFGRDDNAEAGRRLLLGERLPKRPTPFQRRMYLSAFQSRLFNRALAARMAEGTWNRALRGDVLRKADSGGLFVCEDPALDGPRVERFEVSPTGPMFGPKMPPPAHEVARFEEALLAQEGLTSAHFERGGRDTEGARRPYRVELGQLEVAQAEQDLCLDFTLPRGAYATLVVRELLEPR